MNVLKGIAILLLAIMQSTGAFVSSERVLFPIYETGGLLASISAHATWNFRLSVTKVVHAPIRLVIKLKMFLTKSRTRTVS